jgi:hypothetical protein
MVLSKNSLACRYRTTVFIFKLDIIAQLYNHRIIQRDVAQLVARLVWDQEV